MEREALCLAMFGETTDSIAYGGSVELTARREFWLFLVGVKYAICLSLHVYVGC